MSSLPIPVITPNTLLSFPAISQGAHHPAPVELPLVTEEADVQTFRRKARIQPGQRLIGMAARLATEKGVEYLVQAMPSVIERHPQARAVLGQYRDVGGRGALRPKACPADRSPGRSLDILGNLTARSWQSFSGSAS